MNQNIRSTDNVTFYRVDAANYGVGNAIYFGGGNNYFNWTNNRIYTNVGLETAGNLVVAGTIDTGQGATEVYLMDQNLRTTDNVTHNRITSTVATGTSPLVVTSTTVVGNLNADLLDGQDGTYYDQRQYTRVDNYLGGYYVSGGTEKPNNAIFGAGKFKVAMLQGGAANLGFGGTWNDVLWTSTYSGGDVKSSFAIVSDKYSDNVYFSKQAFDSATWGSGRLVLTDYNSPYAYNMNQYVRTTDAPTFAHIGVNPTGASNNGYGVNLYGGASVQFGCRRVCSCIR
jgi:hypothetical protein